MRIDRALGAQTAETRPVRPGGLPSRFNCLEISIRNRKAVFADSSVAVWIAICASTGARGQTPPWTDVSLVPAPRSLHAMAYDSTRRRTVVFGGYYFGFDDVFRGDTWESNGINWIKRSTSGPVPRFGHAMTYDAARSRVVLFGGYDGTVNLGDTWTWDGTTWTLQPLGGPAPRYGASVTYDSGRARVVLFGGYDGLSYLGDTWEWDGTSWIQRSNSGPSPRYGHALAYDAARGRTVLFGGLEGGVYCGDTWEWNGTDWAPRATTGPSPRNGHAMTYDSSYDRVVLFGGYDGIIYLGDTWEWDGVSWEQRSTTRPSPRVAHKLVYDSMRQRLVLFGGSDGAFLADTWEHKGMRLGDLNLDGKFDSLDIAPFITIALTDSADPVDVYIADFDISGSVNDGDIPHFVNALLAVEGD